MSKSLCFIFNCVFVVLLTACGNQEPESPAPSLQDVYRLLDKGDKEAAITELEKMLENDPKCTEAQVLLASAYVGKAHIDIYSIYDTFKDILFSKSLSDRFWKPKSTQSKPPARVLLDSSTPTLQKIILNHLHEFLSQLQQGIGLLERLPGVDQKDWESLEKALTILNPINEGKDLVLYRLLIRSIYLRAYINTEFLSYPRFGTKTWLCEMEPDELASKFNFLTGSLLAIGHDVQKFYKKDIHFLAEIEGALENMNGILDKNKKLTSSGSVALTFALRKALRCGDLKNDSEDGPI